MDTAVFKAFAGSGVPHVPQAPKTWGTDLHTNQASDIARNLTAVPLVPHVPLQNGNGWDEEDWQAAFDERAAILEYDAGMTRGAAEGMARREIDAQCHHGNCVK